jgi:hypothetical protein
MVLLNVLYFVLCTRNVEKHEELARLYIPMLQRQLWGQRFMPRTTQTMIMCPLFMSEYQVYTAYENKRGYVSLSMLYDKFNEYGQN